MWPKDPKYIKIEFGTLFRLKEHWNVCKYEIDFQRNIPSLFSNQAWLPWAIALPLLQITFNFDVELPPHVKGISPEGNLGYA